MNEVVEWHRCILLKDVKSINNVLKMWGFLCETKHNRAIQHNAMYSHACIHILNHNHS